MTKKEISTYLRKFFGYYPTSKEIIYYELKQIPKKELEFTAEDKEEVSKELYRQYPKEYHDPSKPKKRIGGQYITITRRDVINKSYGSAIITTNKERVEYIKKYHSDRGMTIPPELMQVIKKYE